jgi:hypothetical protein
MEAAKLFSQTPRFAITIQRPWTWLIAAGTRRDWVIATDPGALVGRTVALHSAAKGDADGWRQLDRWAEGQAERKVVAERCPHHAIVGVALVVGVDCFGRSWRIRFADAREVAPIGPISAGELELWAIPGRQREALHQAVVELRRAAALTVGGAS